MAVYKVKVVEKVTSIVIIDGYDYSVTSEEEAIDLAIAELQNQSYPEDHIEVDTIDAEVIQVSEYR